MSKIIIIKQDTYGCQYISKKNERTFLVSDKQAEEIEKLINKWRNEINDPEKLRAELEKFFPEAEIYSDCGFVSITQETFYTLDRHELARLERKYGTGLWCDAREGRVFYYFHTFRRTEK